MRVQTDVLARRLGCTPDEHSIRAALAGASEADRIADFERRFFPQLEPRPAQEPIVARHEPLALNGWLTRPPGPRPGVGNGSLGF